MPRLGDEPDPERIARAALALAPPDYYPRFLVDDENVRFTPTELSPALDRLVIVGAGGSGKSMLFASLASIAAEAYLAAPDANPCPILIRGAALAKLIADARGAGGTILVHNRVALRLSEIEGLLSSGTAALWLDGWDEIPREVMEGGRLWSFLSSARRIAISTRPPVHQRLQSWAWFELAPLNLEDVNRIICERAADQQLALTFLRRLREHYDLSDLATSPLLLDLMWRVFERNAALPGNPTTLFAVFVQDFLERWETKRSVINILDAEQRLEFLSRIATGMHLLKEYSLYHGQVIQLIQDVNEANVRAEDVLDDIVTTGLFARESTGRYTFSHKTLMMYLIASRYRHDPAGLASLLRENDSGWRELVTYVGALARQVDGLIEAFLDFDQTTEAAFAFSAGRVSDKSLGKKIADRLERQLGAPFAQEAARHWQSKNVDEAVALLRQRKLDELEQFDRLRDPNLTYQQRGRLFEDFTAGFFTGPFRLISRNVLTLHGEIDLVFALVANGPFWSDLGGQVLVECKNEAGEADTAQVNHFMQKVNNVQNVRLAFFVALSGIGRGARDAIRVQAANPAKPLVVALNGSRMREDLDREFTREDFFVQAISDAKLMRR